MQQKLILWIAQGFGAGRLPLVPGTFGSVVGLLWIALLLLPGNVWWFAAGTIAGIAVSVPLCGRAEILLGKSDPGSVVWDEISALPLAFTGWIVLLGWRTGEMPRPEWLLTEWKWTLGLFVAFRFFDMVKPWPVGKSQSLPGGWGVTMDDVLAALYVNVIFVMAWFAFASPAGAPP